MPKPDPIPPFRTSALQRFARIMRLMALVAVVTAAAAVAIVAAGTDSPQVHMMVATALGVGLSVLLAGALMGLIFLSSSSGHDRRASHHDKEDE